MDPVTMRDNFEIEKRGHARERAETNILLRHHFTYLTLVAANNLMLLLNLPLDNTGNDDAIQKQE